MNQYDQYEHKRREVQAEINKQIVKPISFEVFKKTPGEKVNIANAKAKHKKELLAAGLNPKKHMNVKL